MGLASILVTAMNHETDPNPASSAEALTAGELLAQSPSGPRLPKRAKAAIGNRSQYSVTQIHSELRQKIVTVALRPGAALSEVKVAEKYGVSRTPVREAFKRLHEEGLLDVVPQVGSFVARIDLKKVRDSYFVRDTLECKLVELAAQKISLDEKQQLQAILAIQEQATLAKNPIAFFQADEQMHQLIAEIAGHGHAWQVIHDAKGQQDRLRRLSLLDSSRASTRLNEHQNIVQAIIDGNGAAAQLAMKQHLASILEALATLEPASLDPQKGSH
jgi:GntR family transcriptional regulator, rspAB operon transcriptional repressor